MTVTRMVQRIIFGLFTVDGQAKYLLWEAVDKGTFEGLTRGGNPVEKTFGGNESKIIENLNPPPVEKDIEQ
jgi:hypothetical protein